MGPRHTHSHVFSYECIASGFLGIVLHDDQTADSTNEAHFIFSLYSGTSVHELNSFLQAVREPKCS
jgi:hypothetical protein